MDIQHYLECKIREDLDPTVYTSLSKKEEEVEERLCIIMDLLYEIYKDQSNP